MVAGIMLFRRMVYNPGMPIHDWSQVEAGIFHAFHLTWIGELQRALNSGLLPPDYYALAEQWASGLGPGILTLHGPGTEPSPEDVPMEGGTGVALALQPPKVRYRAKLDESAFYWQKARRLVVRHVSGHKIVATIEVVSPGNKSSEQGIQDFVHKAWDMLASGVHLMVIDLFPPGPRDPQGIHSLIWGEPGYPGPTDAQPLTCVSYLAIAVREAFVEPVGVGDVLPDMPLFLNSELYIPVPLEKTYQSAWETVPAYWRNRISAKS